ncbi:MAG: DNA repair exonuclease, partial [Firmicutes bacterium]|nr:DNA repair exonuclease [Bacillota bacterium]
MRFVHLADAHLDTPFYGQGEDLRRRLREAARTSFSQAVDWALERRADAFLIAGDLFDNDLLSFATERFLLGEMSRLQEGGIQVFYATGNHDPGQAGYRAHALPWPKNVTLFLDGA